MNEQDRTLKTTLEQSEQDDRQTWQKYWKSQGQPWRTQPEIDEVRQIELANLRSLAKMPTSGSLVISEGIADVFVIAHGPNASRKHILGGSS